MTPLTQQEEDDVRMDSIGHCLPGHRECPCGCGEHLAPYNGRRRLVCFDAWQKASEDDRMVVMIPGASVEERRAAARRVIETAHRIRDARPARNGANAATI